MYTFDMCETVQICREMQPIAVLLRQFKQTGVAGSDRCYFTRVQHQQ